MSGDTWDMKCSLKLSIFRDQLPTHYSRVEHAAESQSMPVLTAKLGATTSMMEQIDLLCFTNMRSGHSLSAAERLALHKGDVLEEGGTGNVRGGAHRVGRRMPFLEFELRLLLGNSSNDGLVGEAQPCLLATHQLP